MTSHKALPHPREVRLKRGLNQVQFWSLIGVTQSGGSRYESGRNMSRPVRELFRLVHIEQVDLAVINREDMEVIGLLKTQFPDLYESLKKAVSATSREEQ